MRIQVLMEMGQYLLSKYEACRLLDRKIQVIISTLDLRHSNRNFLLLTVYYLVADSLLERVVDM